MKCRICGCEAPAGAKLCKDCAAARKRAFAATVTQPLLLAAAGAVSGLIAGEAEMRSLGRVLAVTATKAAAGS